MLPGAASLAHDLAHAGKGRPLRAVPGLVSVEKQENYALEALAEAMEPYRRQREQMLAGVTRTSTVPIAAQLALMKQASGMPTLRTNFQDLLAGEAAMQHQLAEIEVRLGHDPETLGERFEPAGLDPEVVAALDGIEAARGMLAAQRLRGAAGLLRTEAEIAELPEAPDPLADP
ncbi:MAG: hypothetical protein QOF68_1067 [Gaiellales bacterium]|nr:hypothetical protein [Gaiellales bacterium]